MGTVPSTDTITGYTYTGPPLTRPQVQALRDIANGMWTMVNPTRERALHARGLTDCIGGPNGAPSLTPLGRAALAEAAHAASHTPPAVPPTAPHGGAGVEAPGEAVAAPPTAPASPGFTLPSGYTLTGVTLNDAFAVGFARQTIAGVLRRGNLAPDEATRLRDALAVLEAVSA
ncbi:hypothetical protein [Ornithinimicrobium cerasi]|uniref:hypothetical protein n=1 Tax=Ornithinimicrobium cerasi TaxID=2248773 RepID=UPI000EFF1F9C|nr:hypothetical protein [Ornithinimicrobium cerasi]